MKKSNYLIIKSTACTLMTFLMISACSQRAAREPASLLDTPGHHTMLGEKLLDEGFGGKALGEFDLAIELDPEFSPAHTGRGLALGAAGRFREAFTSIKLAKKYATDTREKALVHIGMMRLHAQEKKPGWLKEVHRHFHSVKLTDTFKPEAFYYMGLAYREAQAYEKAEAAFKQVLALNRSLAGRADAQLREVQRMSRARAGTREIGDFEALGKITKADLAALLVHQLPLESIFILSDEESRCRRNAPEDIENHPLRSQILSVLSMGIRGLETFPDGRFAPKSPVNRSAFAMTVEDIVAAATRNGALTRSSVGSRSPFPDVDPTAPYFNAVMICTARGLIETKDAETGEFHPYLPVSGADALLAIRRLRALFP